ncbi:hypothetical protein HZA97_06675 [Candidatus Woesearchaeota archaeon]|nr:hypothetical protein [Candidatus Woesearchaeota archaeon]
MDFSEINEPSWPGEPELIGSKEIAPEEFLHDWCYTLWNDKMWFCTVYNGKIDVTQVRNKPDVERAVWKNNFLEGILKSQICGRIKFFFDQNTNVCGVETDYKPTPEHCMPLEYTDIAKISAYLKYLGYLSAV